jgi:HK97 family phage prohead protease
MSEGRVFATEIREVQAVGRPYKYLEGRAVPYDIWADIGWFMEAHAAGSFKRSTGRQPGLPLLLFHDSRSWPAGHAEKWRHDDSGLYGTWKLNDTPEAQLAAKMAEAGDLTGMSIGFMPIRSEPHRVADDWDPDAGPDTKDWIRRLESRLLEVSLTPTPAFEDATVTMVRTAYDYEARARQPRATPRLDHWRAVLEELHSR